LTKQALISPSSTMPTVCKGHAASPPLCQASPIPQIIPCSPPRVAPPFLYPQVTGSTDTTSPAPPSYGIALPATVLFLFPLTFFRPSRPPRSPFSATQERITDLLSIFLLDNALFAPTFDAFRPPGPPSRASRAQKEAYPTPGRGPFPLVHINPLLWEEIWGLFLPFLFLLSICN
jgi:hypothetical protein